MKILVIVNVDWFLYSHRLPIILEANKQGFEVHVATSITDISKKKSLIKKGIHFHELPIDRSGKSCKNLLNVFLKIIVLLYKLKPNVLHLITIQPILLGGIASRIIGINKIVYAISGLGHSFLSENLSSSIRRYLITFMYRIALCNKNRIVIFQNPTDLKFLSKTCSLDSSEVTLINGSGVNLEKFVYSDLPRSTPTILMASRLLKSKGVYEFVNAARILKKKGLDIKFQLVGKPDKSNPLAIKSKELNQWIEDGLIEYLGFQNKMNEIIPKSHIVVLPSYYPEGLPKIICEAAACGRAVITTNQPGCKDAIVEGETGILIETKQSKQLATAILKLIEDPKLLKKMSFKARKRAEKLFNIDSIVEKHIEIYNYLYKLN